MSTTPEIIERLNDEADLCRNDGANDIAALLTDAAVVMAKMYARERACNTVNEGEIIALVRMGQELAEAMGLNPLTASPAEIVQAATRQAKGIKEATKVVAAFERLGKAQHAAELLQARSQCEVVMVKLSEALKA